MSAEEDSTAARDGRTSEGRSWVPFFVWLGLLMATALGLAAAATFVQEFWAPIFLFPLVLGLLLGALAVLLARGVHAGRARFATRLLIAPLLIAALLLVSALHHFSYLRARSAAEAALQKHGSMVQAMILQQPEIGPPANLFVYLQREAKVGRMLWGGYRTPGGWTWVVWGVDALLVIGATVAAPWAWGKANY